MANANAIAPYGASGTRNPVSYPDSFLWSWSRLGPPHSGSNATPLMALHLATLQRSEISSSRPQQFGHAREDARALPCLASSRPCGEWRAKGKAERKTLRKSERHGRMHGRSMEGLEGRWATERLTDTTEAMKWIDGLLRVGAPCRIPCVRADVLSASKGHTLGREGKIRPLFPSRMLTHSARGGRNESHDDEPQPRASKSHGSSAAAQPLDAEQKVLACSGWLLARKRNSGERRSQSAVRVSSVAVARRGTSASGSRAGLAGSESAHDSLPSSSGGRADVITTHINHTPGTLSSASFRDYEGNGNGKWGSTWRVWTLAAYV